MFDASSVTAYFAVLIERFCQQLHLEAPYIPPLTSLDQRLPCDDFEAMLKNVQSQCQIPALGVQIGRLALLSELPILNDLAGITKTCWEFLLIYVAYHRLTYDANDMHVDISDQKVTFSWRTERLRHSQLAEETMLAVFLTVVRQLLKQPNLTVVRVGWIHPEPEQNAAYTDFFGGQVLFESEYTHIQLPITILPLPIEQIGIANAFCAKQVAFQARTALPPYDTFDLELRHALWRCLFVGEPTLDAVALKMELSKRFIEQKLGEKSQDFELILNQTRLDLAKHYINNKKLPVAYIAFVLGYKKVDDFRQQWLTWTGQPLPRY